MLLGFLAQSTVRTVRLRRVSLLNEGMFVCVLLRPFGCRGAEVKRPRRGTDSLTFSRGEEGVGEEQAAHAC